MTPGIIDPINLMIGDYVSIDERINVQVVSVDTRVITTTTVDPPELSNIFIKGSDEAKKLKVFSWYNLFPIKITSLFLLENGFESQDDGVYLLKSKDKRLRLEYVSCGVYQVDSFCTIRYIHELQHIFKVKSIKQHLTL